MSEAELKKFYKGRAKRADRFTYTEDGDLVIYGKKGEVEATIVLPSYRPPTAAEIETMEAERRERIAAAEGEFEGALRELRQLIETGAEASDILAANRRVAVKDTLLQTARYPVMSVSKGRSFPVGDMLFEDAKLDYMIQDVQLLNLRPFTLKDMYVREGMAEAGAEAEAEAEAEAAQAPAVPTIVFDGTDDVNGFMSWDYRSSVVVDGVKYRTAYHAIMAGLANYYGNSDGLEAILATKRPGKIDYGYESVGTTEEDWNGNFEEIAEKVMRAKFAPGTEMAAKLLATGETVLGAIIPGNTLYGIGLSAADPGVGDSGKWTGQNKLGRMLETIRAELAAEAPAAPAAVEASTVKKKKKPVFVAEEEAAAVAPAPASVAAPAAVEASAVKKKKKPVLVAEATAADAIVEAAVEESIAPAGAAAPSMSMAAPAMAAEQPIATAGESKKKKKLRFVTNE